MGFGYILKHKELDYKGSESKEEVIGRHQPESVRYLAQYIAGWIVITYYEHIAVTLGLTTPDASGVSPNKLCVVAIGGEIGHMDGFTMVRAFFSLPQGHGIDRPVMSCRTHKEVLTVFLFPLS